MRFFAEQAALTATPGAVFAFPRVSAAAAVNAPPSTLRKPRAFLASVASPDERFEQHQRLYSGLVHASDDDGDDDGDGDDGDTEEE